MASLLFSASAIPTVLLCIIAGAFCCNLIYTCHEGNFLVVNNLNSVSFDSATASMSSNGTACTTRMSADQNYITITDCGLGNTTLNLIESGGAVTTCEIECDQSAVTGSGSSNPLQFVQQSRGSRGIANYNCHSSGSIFIQNPRNELYLYSGGYSFASTSYCSSSHMLQNEVIEIYDCDTSGKTILSMSALSSHGFLISRKTDLHILQCSDSNTTTVNDGDAPIDYECFSDGTVLVSNPRNELFQYSYSESDNIPCQSMYINGGAKILIFDCDLTNVLILYLSEIPIGENLVIKRNSNLFLINCAA